MLPDRIPVLYEVVSVGRHMVGLAFSWLCISYASRMPAILSRRLAIAQIRQTEVWILASNNSTERLIGR